MLKRGDKAFLAFIICFNLFLWVLLRDHIMAQFGILLIWIALFLAVVMALTLAKGNRRLAAKWALFCVPCLLILLLYFMPVYLQWKTPVDQTEIVILNENHIIQVEETQCKEALLVRKLCWTKSEPSPSDAPFSIRKRSIHKGNTAISYSVRERAVVNGGFMFFCPRGMDGRDGCRRIRDCER